LKVGKQSIWQRPIRRLFGLYDTHTIFSSYVKIKIHSRITISASDLLQSWRAEKAVNAINKVCFVSLLGHNTIANE
jgi:hypothetical protein